MHQITDGTTRLAGRLRRGRAALVLFVASLAVAPAYAFHGAWDAYSHLDDIIEYVGELFSNEAGRCSGSPVYGREGEFFFPEQDVVLAGRPALAVTRTYNSKDPTSGMFGNGWSASCDVRLIRTTYEESGEDGARTSGVRYVLRTADGRRRYYDGRGNGTFETPPGRVDRIVVEDDGMARLIEPTGDSRRFGPRGHLLQTVDRNGNAIDYRYDDDFQLIRMEDANGRSIAFAYDTAGRVVSLTDHGERTWQFVYDVAGNLVSRTDPLGGERRYDYRPYENPLTGHTTHQLIGVADETGVAEVTVTYTGDRVASYTINENVYNYSYNRDGSTTVVDAARSTWRYDYASNGMLASITYPDGASVSYDTDEAGNIVALTDQERNVWSYSYADDGSLLGMSDPLLQESRMEQAEDAPWITRLTSPLGRENLLTYDERGNPLTAADAAGNLTRYEWSEQGDMLAHVDPLGARTIYTYNAAGLTTGQTNPLGETTTYRYDELGRQIGTTLPDGATVSTVYDALDRVVGTTDPAGQGTAFAYDAAGRLLQLNDAGGNLTAFAYDGFGRLASETRPDGEVLTYTYSVDNLLATSTDPRGVVTSYDYDANKRLTRLDTGNERSTFRYDRRGNLVSGAGPDGNVAYTYDELGRVVTEVAGRRVNTYAYSADSELVSIETLGETWRYSHDERGLTTGFETPGGTHAYAYDELGQLVGHTLPNGRRVEWTYDTLGQLTSQDDSSGGGALYTYGYDADGRLLDIGGDGGASWTYRYDALDRLVAADHLDSYVYSYDALGNRLDSGGLYDPFNKLLADSRHDYTYDEAGNLATRTDRASGEVTIYGFNARGRLESVGTRVPGATSATTVATFGYDVQGRLVSRTTGRESTQYHWAGDLLVGEIDGRSNVPSRVYRYGESGWTATEYSDDAGTYYVHGDHLGTPRYLTDALGSVVWRNRMTPYGLDRLEPDADGDGVPVTYNQRFAGQYADAATGFNYNRSRFYDPASGRYISSDPLGIAGGINTYQYALGSPSNYIDPTGRNPLGLALLGMALYDSYRTLTDKCLTGGQKVRRLAFDAALGAVGGTLVKHGLKGLGKVGRKVSDLFKRGRGDSVPNDRATQLAINRAVGQAAERRAAKELVSEGNELLGSQVSVRTSQGRRVIDHLVRDSDGVIRAVEVKAGNAVRNASQLAKDNTLASQGGVLVGKNAPAALRGQRIIIETIERRY